MQFIRDRWAGVQFERRNFIFILTALILAIIYFWHLGSQPLTGAELSAGNNGFSLHELVHNSLDAPHKLVVSIFKHFHSGRTTLRTPSVLFGLIFAYCFYIILRCWFGTFCAWLGVTLFAATPFMILASRSASATVMVLWPLCVIAAYMKWVRGNKHIRAKFIVLTILAALSAYQPGGIIFILASVFMVRGTLWAYLSKQKRKNLAAVSVIFVLLILPFILTAIHQPHLLKSFFLLPQHKPDFVGNLKAFGWSISAFFWHSQAHNNLQIGRLAVLNAAQIILLVFGFYAMWARVRPKIYSLAVVFIVAALAASINSNYNFILFGLPALSLVITAGLRYLHLEWTTIFPRNPLPRGLAIIVMLAVIILQVAWGAHYSLVAWPHSVAAL